MLPTRGTYTFDVDPNESGLLAGSPDAAIAGTLDVRAKALGVGGVTITPGGSPATIAFRRGVTSTATFTGTRPAR